MPAPLALSCGEPSGIGPEIAIKARAALGDALPFFLIGDPGHFPPGTVAEIGGASEAAQVPATLLPVLPLRFPAPAVPGRPDPANAPRVVEAISLATALALEGRAGAVVTNPISKAALKSGAGFAFPGHTEFLASLAGVERVVMMLAAPVLKVVPVTIHIPLSQVPAQLTPELLEETIRITDAALRREFGIATPRLAVAGLNPHAGESGNMGREEIELILPVLDRLAAEDLHVTGPMPADTMFHPSARARYDVAICMYHDQALIPIKTLAFDEGVNVTLGLPFIRTSPDHGTAFDIAGTGTANPSSLIAALKLAWQMAEGRGG